MSSSVSVVISVSTPSTDAMGSSIAVIDQMSETVVSTINAVYVSFTLLRYLILILRLSVESQMVVDKVGSTFGTWTDMFVVSVNTSQLPGPQGCATMRLSFSASQMGAVYHLHGNVMVTQTARMAVMNTTRARLAPALPHSSAVIMETACCAAGFVMETTIAGT